MPSPERGTNLPLYSKQHPSNIHPSGLEGLSPAVSAVRHPCCHDSQTMHQGPSHWSETHDVNPELLQTPVAYLHFWSLSHAETVYEMWKGD